MNRAEEYQASIRHIATAVARGNKSYALTQSPADETKFSLSVGSSNAIAVESGAIISLQLSRAQVAALRDQCDTLLSGRTESALILLPSVGR